MVGIHKAINEESPSPLAGEGMQEKELPQGGMWMVADQLSELVAHSK